MNRLTFYPEISVYLLQNGNGDTTGTVSLPFTGPYSHPAMRLSRPTGRHTALPYRGGEVSTLDLMLIRTETEYPCTATEKRAGSDGGDVPVPSKAAL